MQRIVSALFMVLTLLGCTDVTPNNPYPEEEQLQNIYYSAFSQRPRFLDPARSYTSDESAIIAQIYEPVLEYHYLKRPYELTPQTSVGMPTTTYYDAKDKVLSLNAQASDIAYTVYRIQIQPGIRFAPHPAFAKTETGAYRYFNMTPAELEGIYKLSDFKHTGSRELKAQDYIYEIKRLANPRVGSPILGLMMKYIVGLEDFNTRMVAEYAKLPQDDPSVYVEMNRFDISGVTLIDDYTYEIKVVGKYPQFQYWLAMPFFVPMPWEADVFYAQKTLIERNIVLDWYPVGTGPFVLQENDPNRRMTLSRNPYYRDVYYPKIGGAGDNQSDLLKDAGLKLPLIDGAVFSLEKEVIPLWSKFLQGYYDLSLIASDNFQQAMSLDFGQAVLSPQLKAQGISLLKSTELTDYYWGFNMLDPVVGGYTEQQRKLRQAIAIAIDTEEFITIFLNDRAEPAQGPIPPNIFGAQSLPGGLNTYIYDWVAGVPVRKSIEEAKRLLAEAGYPNGVNSKTGEPLVISFDVTSRGDPLEKARAAWMRKQFNKLNIDLNVRETDWNRFREKLEKGTVQFYALAWLADYPDAENFLFLLYGPNAKAQVDGPNSSNYNSPEFNRLFEQAKSLDNTPEREDLIKAMVAVAQKDSPWVWGYHPQTYTLKHAWMSNLKPSDMVRNNLKYYRVDANLRATLRNKWNQPLIWPLFAVLGVLLILICPLVLVYRYKERYQKPKRY